VLNDGGTKIKKIQFSWLDGAGEMLLQHHPLIFRIPETLMSCKLQNRQSVMQIHVNCVLIIDNIKYEIFLMGGAGATYVFKRAPPQVLDD